MAKCECCEICISSGAPARKFVRVFIDSDTSQQSTVAELIILL